MSKCDCIRRIEKKIADSYAKKEEVEEVIGVTFENVGFFTEGGTQLYGELAATYTKRNKKGELKTKRDKVNMCYNFCPFCGKPYKKQEGGNV